jgi:hypothetical protein
MAMTKEEVKAWNRKHPYGLIYRCKSCGKLVIWRSRNRVCRPCYSEGVRKFSAWFFENADFSVTFSEQVKPENVTNVVIEQIKA